MIMNGEQIGILKEVVFVHLKVFSQTLAGETDKQPRSRQPIT